MILIIDNKLILIETLEQTLNSKKILQLIKSAELDSSDLTKQADQLIDVWELRWGSSKSPFLNYLPLLENLQVLDTEKK